MNTDPTQQAEKAKPENQPSQTQTENPEKDILSKLMRKSLPALQRQEAELLQKLKAVQQASQQKAQKIADKQKAITRKERTQILINAALVMAFDFAEQGTTQGITHIRELWELIVKNWYTRNKNSTSTKKTNRNHELALKFFDECIIPEFKKLPTQQPQNPQPQTQLQEQPAPQPQTHSSALADLPVGHEQRTKRRAPPPVATPRVDGQTPSPSPEGHA